MKVCNKYYRKGTNCIPEKDYEHLFKWLEISAAKFTDGCEIPA